MRLSAILLLILLTIGVGKMSAVPGQDPNSGVSLEVVETWIQNGAAAKFVSKNYLSKVGLAFRMDANTEAHLREVGATDEWIAVLKQADYRPPPLPGYLSATTNERGATVSLDNGPNRVDGFVRLELVPGTYTVRASKAGFLTESKSVTVGPGATTRVDLRLRPVPLDAKALVGNWSGTMADPTGSGEISCTLSDEGSRVVGDCSMTDSSRSLFRGSFDGAIENKKLRFTILVPAGSRPAPINKCELRLAGFVNASINEIAGAHTLTASCPGVPSRQLNGRMRLQRKEKLAEYRPGPQLESQPRPTATEPAFPTVDEILDKFVMALGGRDAMEQVTSSVSTGTVEIPDLGLSGTITLSRKAPNKVLEVINTQGTGEIRRGSDGTSAWEIKAETDVRMMEGAELADDLRAGTFHSALGLKSLYETAVVTGKETVSGKDAYAVLATPAVGAPTKMFFDAESGLLVRQSMTRASPQGPVDWDILIEDYRTVGGLKQSFTMRQMTSGFTLVIHLREIKQNVPLDDALFKRPDRRHE